MSRYRKALVAAAAVAAVAAKVLADGDVTQAEWLELGVAVLAAIGVWGVPNEPAPAP